MKVLLHACCGPCLIEPLDALVAEHDITVYYANPNIHPAEEYALRRDTLLAYARDHELAVIEAAYDPAVWDAAVAGLESDQPARCRACWDLRMSLTAAYAAQHGYDAIATTLSVSPYQDPDGVREAGERAAARHGLVYAGRDFRDRYRVATERSRAAGMYRQNYCGCRYSRVEAEQEREQRRAERRAARERG